MNRRSRIVVVDDAPQNASRWKKQIESALEKSQLYSGKYEVTTLGVDDLRQEVSLLEGRRKALRDGTDMQDEVCQLDDCAVLVIDFDLLDAWNRDGALQVDITGETIAYLARCYSRCGYIVALNQGVVAPNFDLTLRGMPDSFADLNIHESFLSNPGLWSDIPEPYDQPIFRPWYWPIIPKAAQDYENCVRESSGLDRAGIVTLTGIAEDDVVVLPYKAVEFLIAGSHDTASESELLSLTPRQLAANAVGQANPKDRGALSEEQIPRIAAARLRAWLHWVVLPAQNPVTDFPHVVSRIPGILREMDSDRLLSKTINTNMQRVLDSGLFRESASIPDFAVSEAQSKWWPVPALNWRRIMNDPSILELQMDITSRLSFVFCEDVSLFLRREQARLFRSDVLSAYQDRYVADPTKVEPKLALSIRAVDYSPALRLSQ